VAVQGFDLRGDAWTFSCFTPISFKISLKVRKERRKNGVWGHKKYRPATVRERGGRLVQTITLRCQGIFLPPHRFEWVVSFSEVNLCVRLTLN